MTSEDKVVEVEDNDSVRTINAKRRVRDQLENDIEAFLASGGKISQIDNNVTADPPSKPESRYGGRPI